MKNLLFISLLLCLIACAKQEGRKEKPKLEVQYVFTNGLPNHFDGSRPDYRWDFYYVHNYSNADLPLFIKMVDTLSFDTIYDTHSHIFMKYSDDLPDSVSLKSYMTDPFSDGVEADPAGAEFYESRFFTFTLIEGGHKVDDYIMPDYCNLTTLKDGIRNERYFLKDSLTGRFNEIEEHVLRPWLNNTPKKK